LCYTTSIKFLFWVRDEGENVKSNDKWDKAQLQTQSLRCREGWDGTELSTTNPRHSGRQGQLKFVQNQSHLTVCAKS